MSSIVDFAKSKLGIKYTWGGESDSTGYDCSGLTQAAYASAGIKIPRVAADQYTSATKVSRNELRAGDLVFFNTDSGNPSRISHVGIYNGDGTFTHAPARGDVIKVQDMTTGYYSTHFAGGGRYDSSASSAPVPQSASNTGKTLLGKIFTVIAVFAVIVLAVVFFMKAFGIDNPLTN